MVEVHRSRYVRGIGRLKHYAPCMTVSNVGQSERTVTSRHDLRDQWAYPRMHGGTAVKNPVVCPETGLSPHARGNHSLQSQSTHCKGPIPACTGEPLRACWGHRAPRAYPRMHGGTARAAVPSKTAGGLSPHARGNRPSRSQIRLF